MNIKQAKEQIRNTLRAYLTRDALGNYRIPAVRQRPVLLMGPPGIGKTQIMEQIAAEENVGLVSYTITHHTRQSAIGLPFIEKRVYDGVEHTVTEYTMSEILGSVYALTEKTGIREGILFLDEINCVSETLAPMMLQFRGHARPCQAHHGGGGLCCLEGIRPQKGSARCGDLLPRPQEGKLLPHRKQPRGDAVCHSPRLGGSERDPVRL